MPSLAVAFRYRITETAKTAMQYVNLGHAGIEVSRLCLGCMTFGSKRWRDWVLDEDASRPIVQAALEAGINFFDTADVYSQGVSEEITGKLLREMARRDDYVLATKVYNAMWDRPNQRGLSRRHIMESIDASLRRLGVDHVDLYITHRWDIATPIAETMEALNDVVKAGKARAIGASSMCSWQFAKAQHVAALNGWQQFISMQNHYNLIYREEEREMIPQCRDMGVALTPWSPLARGFLAGNRHRRGGGKTARSRADDMARRMYYSDDDFAIVDALGALAGGRGIKPVQIALAWMLHKPGITAPIIGPSSGEQLRELVDAADIRLDAQEIGGLESPYRPRSILGHS